MVLHIPVDVSLRIADFIEPYDLPNMIGFNRVFYELVMEHQCRHIDLTHDANAQLLKTIVRLREPGNISRVKSIRLSPGRLSQYVAYIRKTQEVSLFNQLASHIRGSAAKPAVILDDFGSDNLKNKKLKTEFDLGKLVQTCSDMLLQLSNLEMVYLDIFPDTYYQQQQDQPSNGSNPVHPAADASTSTLLAHTKFYEILPRPETIGVWKLRDLHLSFHFSPFDDKLDKASIAKMVVSFQNMMIPAQSLIHHVRDTLQSLEIDIYDKQNCLNMFLLFNRLRLPRLTTFGIHWKNSVGNWEGLQPSTVALKTFIKNHMGTIKHFSCTLLFRPGEYDILDCIPLSEMHLQSLRVDTQISFDQNTRHPPRPVVNHTPSEWLLSVCTDVENLQFDQRLTMSQLRYILSRLPRLKYLHLTLGFLLSFETVDLIMRLCPNLEDLFFNDERFEINMAKLSREIEVEWKPRNTLWYVVKRQLVDRWHRQNERKMR